MNRSGLLRRYGVVLVVGSFLAGTPDGVMAQGARGPRMPERGVVLRLHFGLKDREPARWDGKIAVSPGAVLEVSVKVPQAGKVQGSAWKIGTRPGPKAKPKSVHDPKAPRLVRPVLLATVEAPPSAKVSVSTAQGDFSFTLDELALGTGKLFLDGQVRIEAVPITVRLTAEPTEDDWPAAARGREGRIWVVYTAYKHAGPLDAKTIHEKKQFDSLKAKGNGDQVRLLALADGQWRRPIDVTPPGLDVWRPTVAVDGGGTVWVVWSQRQGDNWDLRAKSYRPGAVGEVAEIGYEVGPRMFSPVVRLTDAPGADINPVAVTDPKSGKIYVVWQGWRDGGFDILLASLDGGKASPEKRLTRTPANEWWPAAAFDSKGKLHVAFDTYDQGNYDVRLVSDAAGDNPQTIDVAATPRFEARPSIAVDKSDRVWIAHEQAGPNWGKDTGMRWQGKQGEQLYWQCDVVLRSVESGQVRQAVGTVPSEPIARDYPVAKTRRLTLPRLAIDPAGRVWLVFRRHPLLSGAGEVWTSFVTRHTGEGWTEPAQLAHSENLLDNRPAVLPQADDGILVVHSSDGRINNTQSAKYNDLYATLVRTSDPPKSPALAALPRESEKAQPVHPNEPDDVRRLREYRLTIGGKTYQPLRGEFHRHTELTSHRDQDGTLEDMWRYGLDAAGMDWIGNGDHDNGYGVEYLWWMVQKQTDIFHHPGRFLPMFTYERSVVYPSGHRNAMFAVRGIRPLPRTAGGKEELFGTPEKGSPDIKTFYAYLRHFDGICASHTSGTDMGTDWRDHDPGVEPVVEIYQGLRHSYEHEGAPATAKGKSDAIGGFRPAGFVWNALQKGYRLGFQSSSDHYSTHISYAIVWAQGSSRQSILDAFKRRHSYAANDNILLDVRCTPHAPREDGEQMMGDAFKLRGRPTLQIKAIGTQPIARLSIVRGTGRDAPRYVYDAQPNQREVNLSWTDMEPAWGQTNYYYVRLEQSRPAEGYGALAWSSPMWIDVQK